MKKKLLIVTQKMDKEDPLLGFFHRWTEGFSKRFDFVTVICLEKGECSLPENVKVLSLGKEEDNFQFSQTNPQDLSGQAIFNFQSIFNYKIFKRIKYTLRFYSYIWRERKNYDAVFIHMNQEYVLLVWGLWKLWGKKIYLWRNHAKGDFFTRLSVAFSNKVFYTSPSSFTAKFKKSIQMPVGIDTEFFKPKSDVKRIPNSVLFLGRISPVKRVLEFVDWVKTTDYTATIAGPTLPKDRNYGEKVLKNLNEKIKYIGPVTQDKALKLYQTHEIYVNKTPPGSFDKTIVEALASGMKIMVDNKDAKEIKVEDHSLTKLLDKLVKELS